MYLILNQMYLIKKNEKEKYLWLGARVFCE